VTALFAARMRTYAELTKPRIVAMVLVCAAVGFAIASHASWRVVDLLHTVVATGLLASGAGALNQWMERDTDAQMRRTRKRPIPSGRIVPAAAFAFGTALSLGGVLELFAGVNPAAAAAGFVTLGIYLLVYTPLKRRSPICMLVGAIAGAMPPVIGSLSADPHAIQTAATLFAILFAWQMPHAYAIALMYREDYARGGLMMLADTAASTGRHIVGWSAVLVPVSLAPAAFGMAGLSYASCAIVLGGLFLYQCTRLLREGTIARARGVLLASIVYLPLLLVALVGSSR
jgi:heme o synthase